MTALALSSREDYFLSMPQAARFLQVSRGRLAELILDGQLVLTEDRQISMVALEHIGAKNAPEPGRLPRLQDQMLWLLHDWTYGSTIDVAAACSMGMRAASATLQVLRESGYAASRVNDVDPPGGRLALLWSLTPKGEDYVSSVRKPL